MLSILVSCNSTHVQMIVRIYKVSCVSYGQKMHIHIEGAMLDTDRTLNL